METPKCKYVKIINIKSYLNSYTYPNIVAQGICTREASAAAARRVAHET